LLEILFKNTKFANIIKTQKDIFGNTALHLAAITNNEKMLEFLIKQGLSKEIKNKVFL